MESSISNEEPYIDSFFLPEGILDSEDDDVNAPLVLLNGAMAVGGSEALTPADELMPSFLQPSKVTWTAPPLLIPSQTADDMAVFYHGASDDLESRTSTHSPLIASQRSTHPVSPPTQAAAPRRWDDPHLEEVRDCPTHEKDHEPTLQLHPVVTVPATRTGNVFVDEVLEEGGAPPPGFEAIKNEGSPSSKVSSSSTSVPPQRSARPGSKGGAVLREGTKHQRVTSPPPQPSLPPPPLTPQQRDGAKGNNRRQSYASVVLTEAKNEAARDGTVRNQNVSYASGPLSQYATPPRINGTVSNRSAERRHHHHSFASITAAQSVQAEDSTSSGATASTHSAGRPTVTSGPDLATPSRSARQRHPRRQRKPKGPTGPDHLGSDGFIENDSSESQRFKAEPITSDSSSSSLLSSGVDVDASTSSSHTDAEESQSKGECHTRSNVHSSARGKSATERGSAARIPDMKSSMDGIPQRNDKGTARFLPWFDVVSVAEVVAPFTSAWEIVLPLVLGCFSSVGFIFAEVAKVVIMLALGLAETFRYAAEEVRYGGGGAAVSYMAFMFLPACCDLMMASFSLPHFTPHFVSTVTICQLCQQSSTRKLYSTTPSAFFADDRLAEDVSHLVLRVARYALLVAELHEGFSRSNMSYMIADAPTRALIAFALALARSNLLLSPVGWTSASLQWLIACYVGRNAVTCTALVLTGMASVQLIRRVQQPADLEGDTPALRRPTLGGDETRGGSRSGPGKRPSGRL